MDRLARLEAKVEELTLAVEELSGRLHALEGDGVLANAEAPLRPPTGTSANEAWQGPPPPAAAPEAPGAERWGAVALLGRTLMVLGGAYLFRALTESGTLPALAGVGLGLAYALLWLAFADRAAVAGRRLSASFHGAAFALIAAPLAWEAASRFRVLSAVEGSAALAILTGAALLVARRRDLRAVAWLASLAAMLAAWAFMGSVEPVLPAAFVLVLVALADDWVAGKRGWVVLPWVSAAAADVTLAFMLMTELLRGSASEPGRGYGLAALLLSLFLLFAGGAALRASAPGWRARWFDLAQLPVAALVGYGGAFVLALRLPGLARVLGAGSVVAALGALELARRLFERRRERRQSYVFFAWTGLVLLLGGTALLLPPAGRAIVWAASTVALAALAGRRRSVTLGIHACVYAVAAAGASGLIAHAARAFAASGEAAWSPPRPAAWLVLAALAVAASLELPAESPFWSRMETRAVKLALLAVLAWCAFGVACAAFARGLAGAPAADPAALALLRMGVVAAAALLLGWLGRWRRYREAAWLVYPVLVLGAFKLVLEDFLLGRAAELFGALALYGAVLIFAPRVARASQARSGGDAPSEPPGGEHPSPSPVREPAS